MATRLLQGFHLWNLVHQAPSAAIDDHGFARLLYSDNINGEKLTLGKNNGGNSFTPNASAFTSSTSWNPVVVDVNNDDLNDIFCPTGNQLRQVQLHVHYTLTMAMAHLH
ncbi:MAG: hypothetical protein U5K54_15070 [Cytophagales bacterium]|nr:hypothetical protein [Cytophagales bacterium]